MKNTSMKILKFSAKNVKGIKVVTLDPEGQDVVLSGGNGAGKSSVLDAIITTLSGGALPVHRGADRGEVVIDIGPYRVTRTITDKTDKVVVKTQDGATMGEPRTMLKRLVGPLAIDPVAFCTMKPRDQVDLLFDLLPGLRPALKALDEKIEGFRATRAAINVELGRQATFPEPDPGLPAVKIDHEDLGRQKIKVLKARDQAKKALADRENLTQQIAQQEEYCAKQERELRKAQNRLVQLQQNLADAPPPDTSVRDLQQQFLALEAQVSEAIATNEKIAERDRVEALKAQHEVRRREYNDLLGSMKAAEADKAQVLGEAKLPLKGLAVDESGVYYQGVPVQDLSTAERVRVGAAIAVAQNPQAKIIMADDASLLDSNSLKVLREVCRDFQIWMVLNDESGKQGVWIEDGSIREE